MPKQSRVTTKGQQALEELMTAVHKRWSKLTVAERNELRRHLDVETPDDFRRGILGQLDWIGGPREVVIDPSDVAERRRRHEEQIKKHGDFVKEHELGGWPTRLTHLEEATEEDRQLYGDEFVEMFGHGSAIHRERGGTVRQPRHVSLRAADDRSVALRYAKSRVFTLLNLQQLRRRVAKVITELERLGQTTLGRWVTAQESLVRDVETLQGLRWYRDVFLLDVIDEARELSTRLPRDTRRMVVRVLHCVKIASGRPHMRLVCDLMNWRAPRPNRAKWDASTLRRWADAPLRSVRRVFIQEMPGDFDHFVTEQLNKQPPGNFKVARVARTADAILGAHEWCMPNSNGMTNPPASVSQPDRTTLFVSLVDPSEVKVLWPSDGEGRRVSFSTSSVGDGPRQAAAQLVASLLEELALARQKLSRSARRSPRE